LQLQRRETVSVSTHARDSKLYVREAETEVTWERLAAVDGEITGENRA